MARIFQTPRPDKNKDRVGWNASWEKDLQIVYEGMERFSADPFAAIDSDKINNTERLFASMRQHMVLQNDRVTRDVCQLQEDLVSMVLTRMSSDDFERKWKELTQMRREELVLEGLYRASSVGPDMEGYRKWCPDMTVENLAGDGYIDMLKKLIPDDGNIKVAKPTMISHSVLDRYFAKAEGSMPPEMRLFRAYFMDLTLWYILLAFYGESEDWKIYKPVQESLGSEAREVGELALGDDWERLMRQMKKEYKQDKIKFNAVNVCWSCGKDAASLGPGKELKACSRCKLIGRTIWYCSRECQTHDWKQGTPKPHKVVCGKVIIDDPVDDSLVAKPDTKEFDKRIPPPDPMFKRSPALHHQISLLKREPGTDYILINSSDLPDVGIAMDSRDASLRQRRKMFLIMRNRAFKSGEEKAVRVMYRMLNNSFGDKVLPKNPVSQNYPVSRLKEQFESEYGVLDVDSGDVNAALPTKEEWILAEEFLQSLDRWI